MFATAEENSTLLEAIKDREEYLLIYPNTPNGRLEAKKAVQVWLIDCEVDFNRQDAEQLWRAIDRGRFDSMPGHPIIRRHSNGNGGPR